MKAMYFRPETFASTLKAERKKLNMKQSEFSNLVGVTQDAISVYETGRRAPTLKVMLRIAKALGADEVRISTKGVKL